MWISWKCCEKKTDKKELVLEVYHKVFSLNENEKLNIGTQIDFLCDNNLIEKVHTVKKKSKLFCNYVKSKLWKSMTNKKNILSQVIQTLYSKSIQKILISKFGLSKIVVFTVLLIL